MMMSPENIPPVSDNNSSGNRKAGGGGGGGGSAGQKAQPEQPILKCPRCDSSNTKFCYYNNYSLSQPRHFCKTCRRYWTRGGALRNVPIGGGCRKAKKIKSSSSSSLSTTSPRLLGDPGEFGSGFKFLSPATTAPAMEFQLGGLSLPRLHPATAGVYTQFITSTGSNPNCFGFDLLGLNHPLPLPPPPVQTGVGCGGGGEQIPLSSIESLSSINQEMHWKLQQQRLALIYERDKPAINLFQNLEIHNHNNNNNNHNNDVNLRKVEVGMNPTEWFFDQSNEYAPSNTSATTTTTNSCNDNSNNQNNVTNNTEVETTNNGNGISSHLSRVQAAGGGGSWTDFHHFHGLQ